MKILNGGYSYSLDVDCGGLRKSWRSAKVSFDIDKCLIWSPIDTTSLHVISLVRFVSAHPIRGTITIALSNLSLFRAAKLILSNRELGFYLKSLSPPTSNLFWNIYKVSSLQNTTQFSLKKIQYAKTDVKKTRLTKSHHSDEYTMHSFKQNAKAVVVVVSV